MGGCVKYHLQTSTGRILKHQSVLIQCSVQTCLYFILHECMSEPFITQLGCKDLSVSWPISYSYIRQKKTSLVETQRRVIEQSLVAPKDHIVCLYCKCVATIGQLISITLMVTRKICVSGAVATVRHKNAWQNWNKN